MQVQYKTYDSYKDTGTEWLGRIPVDWKLENIRAVTDLKSIKNQPDLEVLSVYREYGVILKDSRDDNHNVTSLDTSNYKVVEPGDLVVNKMKAWQGSMGVSQHKGIVSPAYITCKTDKEKVRPRFLHYLLRSQPFIGVYNALSYGVRVGQWDMHYEDFKKIALAYPSLDEQDRIVAFLDHKTTEIEAAIEKKQRLIELLKEQKSILINQAVTKGLNPKVPMKDSGIKLVGQIPAHWEVKRLKNICEVFGRIGFRGYTASDLVTDGQGAITLSPSNIHEHGFSTDQVSYLSWKKYHESPEIMIFKNDIIFVKTGSSFGKSALISHYDREMTINPQLVVFKKIKMNSALLQLHLSTEYLQTEIKKEVIGGTIPTIGQATISALRIIVPSHDDQESVSKYCDNVSEQFNPAFSNAFIEIEKLKEFKQTLIAHAVTGKIKV